jgi:hypothetical protein
MEWVVIYNETSKKQIKKNESIKKSTEWCWERKKGKNKWKGNIKRAKQLVKKRQITKEGQLANTHYGKQLWSEFLVAVNNDSAFLWDVTLCGLLNAYQLFGATPYLYLIP